MIIERLHGEPFYTSIDRAARWVCDIQAIVLLHCVAVTHAMRANWIPHPVPRFRVVMPATRGCGRSGGMSDPAS